MLTIHDYGNTTGLTREELAAKTNGEVYDTAEMSERFIVHSFMAPFVTVTRKSDQKKGSLEFQHNPRFYHSFSTL
jgi:hypothetical protein